MTSHRLNSDRRREDDGTRRFRTLRQLIEERECLTERHIRRLVAERRIPVYRVGTKLVFDLDEIDAWIEKTRVGAAS